jgi:hypothetical protein
MSDKKSIDDLFQPVKNLLIGTKTQGISEQKNIIEEKNTKIKQCIDKCIQLETQHNLEEYEQFKSEAQRFIMVDTFVMNQRFRQFEACDQLLQGLEMNFNSKMKNLKKKGKYTEKDELDQARFLRLKGIYLAINEDLKQTYGVTVSLLSQLSDCNKKLSSIYDKSALPLHIKENSESALPDDDPLYKDLVDLENDEMFNPTIYDPTIYNKSFPDKMSRDVISNLSKRIPLDDAIQENEVEEELYALHGRKGGSRRRRNKKSRKSRKGRKGRKGRKTRKNY